LTLSYMDEVGFAPSQPVSWSWTLRGQRKRLPYENPQGKRVNAVAALRVSGTAEVDWELFRRTLKAPDLLAFLRGLPRDAGKPLVVVLDNASIHKNKVVKAALPDLWRERIYLYYLPPYSPELNRIERLFRVIKHQGMPQRTYRTDDELEQAIDAAFLADDFTLRTYDGTALYPGLAA
jgi:putative transposase